MKNTNEELMLKKAYEYMNDVTPLNYDCGKLCDSKCCKGNDKDGMLLFPGEEAFFRDKEGFSVYFDETYKSYCVRCNGECDRNMRPLSCRIFPYFLYVKNIGEKAVAAPDIRATDYCPLIYDKYAIDRKFLRKLRITAAYLCQNDDFEKFLNAITFLLTDFNNL